MTATIEGYLEFYKPISFIKIKQIFACYDIEFPPKIGTRDEIRHHFLTSQPGYGRTHEYGTWIKGQGALNDLEILMNSFHTGLDEKTICRRFPMVWARNFHLIDRYVHLFPPQKPQKPLVTLFCGDINAVNQSKLVKEKLFAFWKPTDRLFVRRLSL